MTGLRCNAESQVAECPNVENDWKMSKNDWKMSKMTGKCEKMTAKCRTMTENIKK
jgi:hypothetical protein